MNPAKALEFLDSLKELWIEVNVLRKAALYIQQTL